MKPNPLPAEQTHESREDAVREMFTRVAPHYELMNWLMTAGQDGRWRQEVIQRAELRPGSRLLDLGAGTGDLSRQALRQTPGCLTLAGDFTIPMLSKGQRKLAGSPITWAAMNALRLPFPDASFEAVVSGFLLRNVVDVQQALREQYRVLKPGGRMVALDTTRPRRNLYSPFVRIYLRGVIPIMGRLVSGQGDAYRYLPASTQGFLRAEELVARMAAAGFRQIDYRVRMFGVIAIHWGRK